jgi:chromosome segregation ATPase
MTLEERVRVVEQDVTALHAYAQQTHTEREGWYKEFRDARAEARGWGEFAVKANNKVEEVAELYKAVDAEVRRANGTLEAIEGRLDSMDTRLDGIDDTLKWHVEMLKLHGDHFREIEAMLRAHNERFDRVDAALGAHNERFDGVDAALGAHNERFDQVDTTLAEHGALLREILAKLDGRRP